MSAVTSPRFFRLRPSAAFWRRCSPWRVRSRRVFRPDWITRSLTRACNGGARSARVARGTPSHPLTRALAQEFSNTPGDALVGLAGFVDIAVWDLAAATFET